MPCRIITTGPGMTAIACSRGHQAKLCSTPGCSSPATLLCDYPLEPLGVGKEPRTCDRRICTSCATKVGPNTDYCPPHARLERKAP